MRERNYLEANDIYLRLAIGNSPWPIGVTSVSRMKRWALAFEGTTKKPVPLQYTRNDTCPKTRHHSTLL